MQDDDHLWKPVQPSPHLPTETRKAIDDRYYTICEGLEADQRLKLQELLDLFFDIFAKTPTQCPV